MHDVIGVTEVQLALISTSLEESFRCLHPICFHDLRFDLGCESTQHLLVLEQLDFCIDSRAKFESQYHCVVNFKLDSHSSPRSFLQCVLLFHKLAHLYILCSILPCQIEYYVTLWPIGADDLYLLELNDGLDSDGDRCSCITSHIAD